MSEKFVSKIDYTKWEAFMAEYPLDIPNPLRPTYLQVVDDAKKNRIPFGELGEVDCPYQRIAEDAVKKLILLVPPEERQVLIEGWQGTTDARPADYLAYRLIPKWQPPEKPKELVGWVWIDTLRPGTILLHGGDKWHVMEGNGYHWLLQVKEKDYDVWSPLSPNARLRKCDISASNSEIIWPKGTSHE